MIRALKGVLVVFGLVEIVLGVLVLFFPEQAASGVDELSGYLKYTMASLGICLIVPGVFLILAAWNPLRHINWVRFAIVWSVLGFAIGLYAIAHGDVEFSEAGIPLIIDAVFAVAFLALYPYRVPKGS